MSDLDAFDVDDGGLTFWHPVDNTALTETDLPWGDVAAGSSADQRLRVCNLSDDYTATAIVIAVAGPADPAAADASGQHLLSTDGDTFTRQVTLGGLAPGQVSDPVTLRRTTAPGTTGGLAGWTLTATAGDWVPATAGTTTTTTTPPAGDTYDPDAATPPVDDPEGDM